MKKIYNLSANASRIANPFFKLTFLILTMSFMNVTYGQSVSQLVNTSPVMVDNVVTLNAGGMLTISVPGTEPGQVYRIQRTYPADQAYLEVTSQGGVLKVPAFKVNSSGKQVVTVTKMGNGDFAFSFILDAKAGPGIKAKGLSLFSENTGGVMYGPMGSESISTAPPLEVNGSNPMKSVICEGGSVVTTINGATNGLTYRLQQTFPFSSGFEDKVASGGVVVFTGISPVVNSTTTWTVTESTSGFGYSFIIEVIPDPTAPTLTLSQAEGTVCAGPDLSASLNVPGSGGYGNMVNAYEYSTDGGTTWTTYSLGSTISSTLYNIPSVIIKAKRYDTDGRGCSAERIYTWTIDSKVHDITGPAKGSYCTIQQAIDAASTQAGDELQVEPGNYPENLQINKANLTLKSTTLHAAIIQTQSGFNAGSGYGGITFLADGCTLDGFKIEQNVAQAIIHTHNSNDITIKNNWIIGMASSAPRGIDVGYASANSDGVVIQGNIFEDLYCGVYINQASDLTIDDNDFIADMGDGCIVFDGTWNYNDVNVTNNSATDANYLLFFYGDPQGAVTHSGNTLSNTLLSNWKVVNITKNIFYPTIQLAVTGADATNVIEVAEGVYQLTALVNINKQLTIQGKGRDNTIVELSSSWFNVGGSIALTLNASGIIIKDIHFKVVGAGAGDILGLFYSDAQIRNNKFSGEYSVSTDPVTRATVWSANAMTGIVMDNNIIQNLRQPGYLSNGSGVISNNTVNNTRGWVIEGIGTLSYTGNIFGTNSSHITILDQPTINISGLTINNNDFSGTKTDWAIDNRTSQVLNATCNWFGTDDYPNILPKNNGPTLVVPYLLTSNLSGTCGGGPALPIALSVTHEVASENILVQFTVDDNDLVLNQIAGNPTDPNVIAGYYQALAVALAGGNPAAIQAAALALGDDVITEYYYYTNEANPATKTYLKTAANNDLVKSKYWQDYLVRVPDLVRFPNWLANRTVIDEDVSYLTNTNPATFAVAPGWLNNVLGRNLYVTVTFINNGYVNSTTQSVAIPAGCIVNTNTGLGYPTIQAAINATETQVGHTIELCPGTFNETVTINKSIHLKGQAGQTATTIIAPPSTLPAASDPLSSIVIVSGSGVNAEISGLTIQGPGPSGCGSMGRGIFVRDGAYANIHDNRILDIRDNPFSGCQNGIAVQVGRMAYGTTGTATIANNLITGYQKGAIVVDNTLSSATISGNTITGAGTTAVTAQNGIQISRGATATISGNTVSGNSFHLTGNSSDWGACGILLYQSGAVALTGGNTLSGNDNNYYAYGGITGALTMGAEIFGASPAPVTNGYYIGVSENINIDASLCTFEGVSPGSASLTQLFAIEDRILHSVDDPAKTGFVKVMTGNVYVTPTETDAHIQNGIDAAVAGDIVHVHAGDYGTEIAANRVFESGTYQFGLFIDKDNLTVQGYTASNSIPATAAEAAVLFTTNATNNFGYSGTMVAGNNITLAGLVFGDNLPSNDKAIEVVGNGFAINACMFVAGAPIYIGDYLYNENGTPGIFTDDLSSIQSYSISNCHFAGITSTGGVYIANGAGWNGSAAASVTGRSITGNVFDGMTTLSFAGLSPGYGWLLYPTGAATVTGNTFTNPANTRYIQSWGVVQATFPYASYWNNNTFPKKTLTTIDGNPDHVRGYDASSAYLNLKRIGTVIQPRIDFAQNGDVILVGAGNYNEDVTVNKTVTLIGAGYSNTIVSGPIGGAGATMQVTTAGVVIDGFSLTRDGNNITDWTNPGLNTAGIAIQSQGNFAEVKNCSIYGNRTGIDVNNSNGNNIHNNLIDNNRTGLIFRNQTDNTTFTNNFVTNNWTIGLLFLDGSGGTNTPVQTAINSTFSNNNISGNWYGDIQDRQSGGAIPAPGVIMKNFECNWYGNTNALVSLLNSTEPGYAAQIPVIYGGTALPPVGPQPDVMGEASANLDYISYLTNGTDNNGSALGFQPVPGSCGGSPVVISSAVPDHITCNETTGSIVVTFTGGTAPYNITWTGGSASGVSSPYLISGLSAGNYAITVSEFLGSVANSNATIQLKPVALKDASLALKDHYQTIQAAIDAAMATDVIEVCAGTYNEQVLVTKGVKILGLAPQPVIDFTGTVSGKPALFDVSADGVTIENLNFNVDLAKLRSAIIASAAGIDNITVKDNVINCYGTPAGSYGERNAVSINYAGYRVATGGVDNITFTGNTVNAGTYPTMFRSGISVDEGEGTFSGNTLKAISADILVRFAASGNVTVSGNHANGGGMEFADFNAGTGTLSITGNFFDDTFYAGAYNALRLKNNYTARTTVVSGNTFTGFVGNGVGYGGTLSLENYQAVTIDNNTFTPLAGSTTYRHITVNTKDFSTSSGYYAPVIGATFTKNTFNGSGTLGGTAIGFYNWDNDSPVFNAFVIGTAGNENTFNDGIATFIHLDNSSGTVAPNSTTMVPWAFDLNVENNLFSTSTPTLPANMTSTQLFALEDKVFHSMDNAALGLVTWVANNDYVTLNTLGVQRGINAAGSTGWTVNVAPGTYPEILSIDKSISILGPNAAINPNVVGDATLVNSSRVAEAIIKPASTSGAMIVSASNGLNVVIKGFIIDRGNGTANDARFMDLINKTGNIWTYENNIFQNAPSTINGYFYLTGTTTGMNFSFNQNRFTDNGNSNGLAFWGSNPTLVSVTNNVWYNNMGWAINSNSIQGSISGNSFVEDRIAAADIPNFSNYQNGVLFANIDNNINLTANLFKKVHIGLYLYRHSPFSGTVNATQNIFDQAFQNAVRVLPGASNPDLTNVSVNNNAFLSGSVIEATGQTMTLNATCNWFGTSVPTEVLALVLGNVNYTPYLTDGNDGPEFGFQPTGTCTAPCELEISVSSTPANCPLRADGTATVTIDAGGNSPSILWSPGGQTTATATGLTAGTYTVTVTNIDGCSATASVDVLNDAGPIVNTRTSATYCTVQAAINDAATVDGDEIKINVEDFTEPGQILLTKSLTLTGLGKSATILRCNISTGTGHANDGSAWILTSSGKVVSIKDMTIDGTGKSIWTAVRFKDEGLVENVAFNNIKMDAYYGIALQVLDGDVDVNNCGFTQIGRIGVHVRGSVLAAATPVADIKNMTYTGKGVVDGLDYAVEFGGGGKGTVDNLNAQLCKGVASDGSTSAGILVTDYYGTITEATITNSVLTNNTTGIAVGYDASDASIVVANNNKIYGNTEGLSSTGPQVNAENNWWGDASGPLNTPFNTCGLGNEVSANVDFNPWWTTPTGVGTSGTLAIHNVTKDTYYCRIQAAIDDAADGNVIEVAAGTYDYISEGSPAPSGLIKVTKGVTIKAAAGARPIIDGSGFDGVFKIHPSALLALNTVIIEGFEIKGNAATGIAMTMQGCFDVTPAKVIIRDNWFHGMVGGIDFWGAGAYLPSGWTSALANIEITGNKFYDMVAAGPYPGFGVLIEDPANWTMAGGDYAVKIQNNEFSNLPTNGSNPGVGIALTRANDTWEAANIRISGNSFTSTVPVGVAFQDGDVSTALVTENSFNNSVYGILASGIDNGPVNATCNWYGTNTVAGVAAKISGPVTYSPWLTSGTDNSGDIGFQPVPGACAGLTNVYVNDASTSGDGYTTAAGDDATGNGTASAPYATITKAVNVAMVGANIKVDAGTYQEQVLVGKSLNIIGWTRELTIVKAPVTLAPVPVSIWSPSENVHPVIYASGNSNTVNISKLTIDGDNGRTVNKFFGALYYEANGTFDNSRITAIHDAGTFSGAQAGIAFYGGHIRTVTLAQTINVTDNIIDDYQKGGVIVDAPGTSGAITGNTITGQNVAMVTAQNGIQLSRGASGTISGNAVSNNIWNKVEHPHEYTAAGILLYLAGTSTIVNNNLTGNEVGLSSSGSTGVSYGINNFTNNKIHLWLDVVADVNADNVYDKYVLNPDKPEAVFGCIQYGIDEAAVGNTLNASAGTFVEQLHITENITIQGAGDATIVKSPATLPISFTTSAENKPVIFVDGASVCNIKNLLVDGDKKGNANYRFLGIAYWNAGGFINNVEVINVMDDPFSGSQHGNAIYAYNNTAGPYNLALDGITVSAFQKGAVVLNGNGNLTVDVDNVDIAGAGPTTVTAQNGIQIWGASGTVNDCNITGINYTGSGWASAGLLVIEGNIEAENVDIDGCQTSVYFNDASGSYSNSIITNPQGVGVMFYNPAGGAQSLLVDGVSAAGNMFTDQIGIEQWSTGGLMDLTVTNSEFTNWIYAVYGYGNSTTLVTDNNLSGNTYGLVTFASTTQNAENNWWGANSGPYDDPENPCGEGSAVYGNVDYDPWYTNAGMTTLNGLPVLTLSAIPDISTVTKTPVIISETVTYPDLSGYDPAILTDAVISSTTAFAAGTKVVKVIYTEGSNPSAEFTVSYPLTGTSVYLSDILGTTATPLVGHSNKVINWKFYVEGATNASSNQMSIQAVSYFTKTECNTNLGTAETFTLEYNPETFDLSASSISSCNNSIQFTETNIYPVIQNVDPLVLGDARITSDIALPAGTVIDWTYNVGVGSGTYTLPSATTSVLLSTIISNGPVQFVGNSGLTDVWGFTIHGLMLENSTYNLTIESIATLDAINYVYNTGAIELIYNDIPRLTIQNPAAVCNQAVDITTSAITSGSDLPLGTVLSYWTDVNATSSLPNPSAVLLSGTYYIKAATPQGCFDIKPVVVITDPLAVGGTITPPISMICVPTNNGTLTLGGYTGSVIRWEQSNDNGTTWTPIANITPSLTYTNLAQTTQYRAVVHSGICADDAYSAIAKVYTGVITTIGSPVVCNGQQIKVPVTVKSFKDVGQISLKMGYDATKLNYIGVFYDGIPESFSKEFSAVAGVIKLSAIGSNYSLANDAVLFTLTFSYTGLSSAGIIPLTFDDSNDNSCEYASSLPPYVIPFCDDPSESYYLPGTITVNALPVCSITGSDGPVCPLSSNTYSAPLMSTYAWTITGNGSISGVTNLQEVTVIVGAHCTESYTLTLVVTDANGCTSTCQKTTTVQDITAPTITLAANSPTVECDGAGNTVDFAAWLSANGNATASDACGSAITWSNNYVVGNWVPDCGNTKHVTVIFTATDACNNAITSTGTFTIEDQTPPTLTCPINQSKVANCSNDKYTVVGTDFDPATSDNCGGSVTTSWSLSGATTGTGNTTLAGVLFNVGITTVTWTGTDACDNEATCFFDVEVTMAAKYTISGKLEYYHFTTSYPPVFAPVAMNNVTLALLPGTATVITGNDGSYQFSNVCPGEYTIKVTDHNKEKGGINSTDAGLVNYWGAIFGPIEHVKFLAGDVSNDKYITGYDAQRIQKYFVNSMPFSRDDWSYWKKGDLVNSNADPNSQLTSFTVNVSSTNVPNYDLYAMCTGDFNGSFVPNALKSFNSSLLLTNKGTMVVGANEEFELPIRAASAMNVSAVSLILDIPSDMVEVQDIEVNGSTDPVTWAVNGNELRIGWNSTTPVSLPADGSLLTLKLRTTDAFAPGNSIILNLLPDPLNELADADYGIIENAVLMVAQVDNGMLGIPVQPESKRLSLSNYPNPFIETTTVVYEIPADGKVTIEVHNILGQKVTTLVDKIQSAGKYSLVVDGSKMQQGVYTATLRLKAMDGDMVRTIRFIVNQK